MRHRSDCRGRNGNNCCICICIYAICSIGSVLWGMPTAGYTLSINMYMYFRLLYTRENKVVAGDFILGLFPHFSFLVLFPLSQSGPSNPVKGLGSTVSSPSGAWLQTHLVYR